MGVLGITPFLQKTCPEVFKRLPDRLRSLRGKTVVIDGTLVTQRLHFAPMPHSQRHIIGWHRILTELKDSDVRTICVFDGKLRSAAKTREVERRRESRKIDAARGSIETNRLHRLQKLMRLLPYYRSLSTSDRQRINDALKSIRSAHSSLSMHVSGFAVPTPTFTPRQTPTSLPHVASSISQQLPYILPQNGVGVDDLQEVMDFGPVSRSISRSDPSYLSPSESIDDPNLVIADDALYDDLSDDILRTLPSVNWNAAVQSSIESLPESVESFESELSTLYTEYNQCMNQLASMPSPFEGPVVQEQEPSSSDVTTLEARIEYAMSKQQLQMTLDEGLIWGFLATPSPEAPLPEIELVLSALAQRSTTISRSYQRRASTATERTYEECKELIRAMGVPCLESNGAYEAEALASALVIHGHADYVVSEDTDVLVYEAPMLRGITTRESPIVVIRGEAIRRLLQLDRASYIDFALLLGTDFSQRIKNVGPARALQFIREHGSIERIVKQESKYPPRIPIADYLTQVGLARLVFQTLPPLPDVELLNQTASDQGALLEIIQRHGLHRMLPGAWDPQSALGGNYFSDDPSWG